MKSKIERYISEKVKLRRKEKSISQAKLAKLLGVSNGFIGQAESGDSPSKFNLNHLNELSRILDCPIAHFLPDTYLEGNIVVPERNFPRLEVVGE